MLKSFFLTRGCSPFHSTRVTTAKYFIKKHVAMRKSHVGFHAAFVITGFHGRNRDTVIPIRINRIPSTNERRRTNAKSVNTKKTANLLSLGGSGSGITGESKALFFQSRFTVTWRHRDCVLSYIWFTPTKRIWIILNSGVGAGPRNFPRGAPSSVRRISNALFEVDTEKVTANVIVRYTSRLHIAILSAIKHFIPILKDMPRTEIYLFVKSLSGRL